MHRFCIHAQIYTTMSFKNKNRDVVKCAQYPGSDFSVGGSYPAHFSSTAHIKRNADVTVHGYMQTHLVENLWVVTTSGPMRIRMTPFHSSSLFKSECISLVDL